jgi:hypothetical protein
LAEIDIGKDLAKRLRKLAPLSEEELAKRIEQKRAEGKLTKTAILSDSGTRRRPKITRPKGEAAEISSLEDSGTMESEEQESTMVLSRPERLKSYHLLLDFLLDLGANPESYDPEILAGDQELGIIYGRVRRTFLLIVKELEPR